MATYTKDHFAQFRQRLGAAQGETEVFDLVVNMPFEYKVPAASLFLGIIVLLQVDAKTNMLNRVALSDTELARAIAPMSPKKFEDIAIPWNDPTNIINSAIKTGKPRFTADWYYLLTPALSPQQARLNQASGAIAFSAVYPMRHRPAGGALIFNYYQYPQSIGWAQRRFMGRYADLVSHRLDVLY